MKKQWITKSGVLILVAVLAISAFWAEAVVTGKTHSGNLPAEAAALPAYRYETVQARKVTLTTELPGRVSAFMVSEVRPQVSGIITERLFTEGSDVSPGQVLYQIDPSIYEAALGNAKAALARAEANEQAARLLAERYNRLVKTNAISRQERDDAVAAYGQTLADIEAARQAVETANINLGYTQITAPVSGRISRSMVTPGALATQHQADALATIQQLDRVYVDVTYSSAEILKLRLALAKGDISTGSQGAPRAKLRLENGAMYARLSDISAGHQSLREIEGDLLFSEVTIEQSTGVVAIRALFDNPDKILLPGMYVRAVVEQGTREDGILAPQMAVMRDTRGRAFVYVLTRETPEKTGAINNLAEDSFYVATRHVQIDRHYDNMWLLSAGLEPGDKLLLQGLQKVRPGQIVTGIEGAPSTDTNNTRQAR